MKTKEELKQAFKALQFKVGVFQILNSIENKIYLQTSTDLDRAFNSDLFQLKAGLHANTALQNDWNRLGAECFEFTLVDQLKVNSIATKIEIQHDLNELMQMHKVELNNKGIELY